MIYKLPDLAYPYDALEPHIDARTMEIHLTKHHAGYVANLNKAIEGFNLGETSIEDLLSEVHTLPDEMQTAVRNHGGGHANHSLFWTILSSRGAANPAAIWPRPSTSSWAASTASAMSSRRPPSTASAPVGRGCA